MNRRCFFACLGAFGFTTTQLLSDDWTQWRGNSRDGKWNEQGQLSQSKSLSKEVSFDEQALETPTKVLASPHTKRETLTRSVGSKRSLMRMDLKMVKGMQKYGKCKFSANDILLLICNYGSILSHQLSGMYLT